MQMELKRNAGILLPIFSLHSPYGIGTLGKEAYDFVDYLISAGQCSWQILSLNDLINENYISSYAGNPDFIDIDTLVIEGLLNKVDVLKLNWNNDVRYIDYDIVRNNRYILLKKAYNTFKLKNDVEYKKFVSQNLYWLENYSLFVSLKKYFKNKDLILWDDDIKYKNPKTIKNYILLLKDEIEFNYFLQYKFYSQWRLLKKYANENGIKIIGEIPFKIAVDSADVWNDYKRFINNSSEIFNDSELQKKRIEYSSRLYDIIKIDKYIGTIRYFSVSDGLRKNLDLCENSRMIFDNKINEISKEDILSEKITLRNDLYKRYIKVLECMKIKNLNCAFDENPYNSNLPINYNENTCVYISSEYSETDLPIDKQSKQYMLDYLNITSDKNIIWDLVKSAYSSVASTVIVSIKDLIEDNLSDKSTNYFRWRIKEDDMQESLSNKLNRLCEIYGR